MTVSEHGRVSPARAVGVGWVVVVGCGGGRGDWLRSDTRIPPSPPSAPHWPCWLRSAPVGEWGCVRFGPVSELRCRSRRSRNASGGRGGGSPGMNASGGEVPQGEWGVRRGMTASELRRSGRSRKASGGCGGRSSEGGGASEGWPHHSFSVRVPQSEWGVVRRGGGGWPYQRSSFGSRKASGLVCGSPLRVLHAVPLRARECAPRCSPSTVCCLGGVQMLSKAVPITSLQITNFGTPLSAREVGRGAGEGGRNHDPIERGN
jgi:hypothetical protein